MTWKFSLKFFRRACAHGHGIQLEGYGGQDGEPQARVGPVASCKLLPRRAGGRFLPVPAAANKVFVNNLQLDSEPPGPLQSR